MRFLTSPSLTLWMSSFACILETPGIFSFRSNLSFKERLRVAETWDDDLVLTVGDQFKTIRKITEDERDIALRICWDKKGRKCSVYTPVGELITDWDVPEDSSREEVQNWFYKTKDGTSRWNSCGVHAWDGKPPCKNRCNAASRGAGGWANPRGGYQRRRRIDQVAWAWSGRSRELSIQRCGCARLLQR